jgi:penicillin-binding protein 2
MIQGAKSGGGVAAPVAHKILSESLALEGGYAPKIAWLDPLHGNLSQISEISLKEEGGIGTLVATTFKGVDQKPGIRIASVDEETSDHTVGPDRSSGTGGRDAARPDVRAAADARGRVTKPNFFQRIFGAGRSKNNPTTPPTPGHR